MHLVHAVYPSAIACTPGSNRTGPWMNAQSGRWKSLPWLVTATAAGAVAAGRLCSDRSFSVRLAATAADQLATSSAAKAAVHIQTALVIVAPTGCIQDAVSTL